MKYLDGTDVLLGDKVRFSNGDCGEVVFSIDTNEYSKEFPEHEWSYLKTGIMIRTSNGALVRLENIDDDRLVCIERKSGEVPKF